MRVLGLFGYKIKFVQDFWEKLSASNFIVIYKGLPKIKPSDRQTDRRALSPQYTFISCVLCKDNITVHF
jgi:hypothetical protein